MDIDNSAMGEDNYVLYMENGQPHSMGYPIQNIFKQLDIPAIRGSHHPFGCKKELRNLAIPAGLVYMHSMVATPQIEEHSDIEPTNEDLYSRLLLLIGEQEKGQREKGKEQREKVGKKVLRKRKTRRKRKDRKKKTRKK